MRHTLRRIRRSTPALFVVLAAATLGVFGIASAQAHFVRSSYAFKANDCTIPQRSDPVTMIFYGSYGDADNSDALVRSVTGWRWRTGGDQWLRSHGLCLPVQSSGCRARHAQSLSHPLLANAWARPQGPLHHLRYAAPRGLRHRTRMRLPRWTCSRPKRVNG